MKNFGNRKNTRHDWMTWAAVALLSAYVERVYASMWPAIVSMVGTMPAWELVFYSVLLGLWLAAAAWAIRKFGRKQPPSSK